MVYLQPKSCRSIDQAKGTKHTQIFAPSVRQTRVRLHTRVEGSRNDELYGAETGNKPSCASKTILLGVPDDATAVPWPYDLVLVAMINNVEPDPVSGH
ncbi:hypothetical protein KCU73_g130, partial [Aureobasidium melanogenum]